MDAHPQNPKSESPKNPQGESPKNPVIIPPQRPAQGRHARPQQLLDMLSRDEDWLIVINADPDAMAAALALKRIFARRVGEVYIARVNELRRPDNLAMIRYLRIPMLRWDSSLCGLFRRFALVDSQPHHSPLFAGIPFSVVIDHHPPATPAHAIPFMDIRPSFGSTSTMMTEYLRALRIRPGALLATALQYGIRTDTASFTRNTSELDMRAYQTLAKHSDVTLLKRIMHSEYLPEWLPYFTRAFASLHACGAGGYAFLDTVENPDVLVVVADFFTRVHGMAWIAICGVYADPIKGNTIVVIFRGDGRLDLGRFAAARLDDLGSAGGHRGLARAELPLAAAEGRNVEVFIYRRLSMRYREDGKSSL